MVKLKKLSSLLLLLSSVFMACSIPLPLWTFWVRSYQYPEGLVMHVYLYKVGGRDLVEINVLNHYIGMKPLKNEDFPQFKIFPFWVGGIAILTFIVAFVRKKILVLLPISLTSLFGVYGLYLLYTKLYEYGHNLSPKAAMKIPPFTPPILGTNKFAQFTTLAYFDVGALLILISTLLMAIVLGVNLLVKEDKNV
jgi:hypothetical protein